MFWNKNKTLGSDEYERLNKKVVTLEDDLRMVKEELDKSIQQLRSLRGYVNRLGDPNKEEDLNKTLGLISDGHSATSNAFEKGRF